MQRMPPPMQPPMAPPMQPQLQAQMPGPPPTADDGPPTYPMYLYYEGQRAQIMQPRFVIGRSRSASDFAINDSNVSRQHAAVEWLRGHYHIVDLGSTNGIQFNGRRVERKVIYDNDVIVIAGHQIRFARQ
jgi:neural Wiskott-Aldrich syndrome protein